ENPKSRHFNFSWCKETQKVPLKLPVGSEDRYSYRIAGNHDRGISNCELELKELCSNLEKSQAQFVGFHRKTGNLNFSDRGSANSIQSFPKSMSTPIVMKATATMRWSHSVGTYWVSRPPKRTARSETK